MKSFLVLLALLPTVALAQSLKLPNPAENQEICYYRAYSAEHLKKNPKQKIKGVAMTMARHDGLLYSTIEIRDLNNKAFTNGGGLLKADGSATISNVNASSIAAQMDGDSGRFLIIQNSKNKDKAQIKVVGSLHLEEEIYTEVEEGTELETMNIAEGSEDSIMNVDRARSNGSAKSCSEILEDELNNA